jgi:hypothetical protein
MLSLGMKGAMIFLAEYIRFKSIEACRHTNQFVVLIAANKVTATLRLVSAYLDDELLLLDDDDDELLEEEDEELLEEELEELEEDDELDDDELKNRAIRITGKKSAPERCVINYVLVSSCFVSEIPVCLCACVHIDTCMCLLTYSRNCMFGEPPRIPAPEQ